ncbi:hypothetical protein HanPSC8_Chr01g0022591 [Helianthus annuus]|nr:hypothetical protein HanPSC8_Chr01g0022591 [Helianthus annuus]
MTDIQMPPEYGAIYPQESDTVGDAPAGYVTMWSNFFAVCNLRLPLTVFVAEVLEWYKLHISQLSPFGMIQVRNFDYTFRALGIEPTVGDFRRFYQMTVSIGFFSFRQWDDSPKLMVPPKGLTKWKTKFFYIKVVAITARLQFRNITDTIISENISIPRADTVDWFPNLQIIGWVKLDNTQLWVLPDDAREDEQEGKARGAEEKMFCPDFKGKVVVLPCEDGEEGFNYTICDNFRLPERDAMEVVLPQGKDLGDPNATGVPKQHVEKHGDKRFRRPKRPHEPVVVPHLVPEVAGISHVRLRKYNDYVVVSDTLEGLGVLGGGAAAGGSSAGSKPADDKKRKGDAHAAGGQKGPKLRRTQRVTISTPTPAVTTEPREEPVNVFATIPSSPEAVGVETQKEDKRSPSIEVVTSSSLHAEDTAKKFTAQTIDDTLDSSNNLIYPNDAESQGARSRNPLLPRNRSPPLLRSQNPSLLRSHPVQLLPVWGLKINLPFSLARLNWSFISAPMRKTGVWIIIALLGLL